MNYEQKLFAKRSFKSYQCKCLNQTLKSWKSQRLANLNLLNVFLRKNILLGGYWSN